MVSILLSCVIPPLLLSVLFIWASPRPPSSASAMEPTDAPMLRRLFRSPALRRDNTWASTSSTGSSSTVDFYGSQVDNPTVINYSYTDRPSRLLLWDVYYFFYYIWALPYIILPLKPLDSGHLSELAPTRGNMWCIFIHVILAILQLAMIVLLPPVALVLPLWATLAIVAVFVAVNKGLCTLINADQVLFHSDPEYAAPNQDKFAHEQWIFLNGVACGDHWMKSCLNRLALTFGRPIIGVHNRTDGVILDVIECLVQRNLGYATNDVRVCYRIIKEKLYNPQYSKIVFILHSQGGIEGGMVLDWLLQELPQNLLSKLEVYTFGNAANHFNNPYRTVASQCQAEEKPLQASLDVVARAGNESTPGLDGLAMDHDQTPRTRTRRPPTPRSSPPPIRTSTSGLARNAVASPHALASQETSHQNPATQSERAIGHIEHYAHTTDFVALWGVLHFATSATADRSMPRFIGRLFSRTDARGGHQFVQHYLDGMFPLARDPVTGKFLGCREVGNEFMESEIVVGRAGDAGANEREAFASSYLGCSDDDSDGDGDRPKRSGAKGRSVAAGEVLMHNGESPLALRKRLGLPTEKVKVKELSRLWKYRNGRSPVEKPPFLGTGMNGFVRNATL
jgi:hypothetical protein